jgi:hypothetical protein
MIQNIIRVVGLARSVFVSLLYDDDLLYPDYLQSTVTALQNHPNAGFVHTGFDLIDANGKILERGKMLVETSRVISVEAGTQFIERSMRQDWMVCSASTLFRASALDAVGRFPVDEGHLADVQTLRRIALHWDVACISRLLVAYRIHASTSSAGQGTSTGEGYVADDSHPQTLFAQRIRFLDEARLPSRLDTRLRSIADNSLRRDEMRSLVNRARAGAPWGSTNSALMRRVLDEPRDLVTQNTWRLIAVQLGGRYAVRLFRRSIRGAQVARVRFRLRLPRPR